ncbi:Mut7-C RNAse domain protein [uncultured archaeon]|nr:Mut7-C RNAse domain protein [uncultured archaeon]
MAKIYADVMLAKLARWLRLAGISVLNAPYVDDTELLYSVAGAKGILLTSDVELSRRS